jgi:hypothetical protein
MGKGKSISANIAAGSCWAIGFGICFLVVGLPMLIGGIVLVQIFHGNTTDALVFF